MRHGSSEQDWNQGNQDYHYQHGQDTYEANYDQSAPEAYSNGEQEQEEPQYQNPDSVGGAETPGVQEVLQRIIEMEPNTEFLDLSNQKIRRIEEIEAYLLQLRNLQDLNLEDNLLESLPQDLSLIFPQI